MDEWELQVESRITAIEFMLTTFLANELAKQSHEGSEEFKEHLLSAPGTLEGLMDADHLAALKKGTADQIRRLVKQTSEREHEIRKELLDRELRR